MIVVPLRTAPGLNVREHFRVRAKRVKKEREAVAWMLKNQQRPPIPCSVLLTRVAPSRGLDDDNLAGSLKGVRDEIANWLGVDDAKRERVRYHYAQFKGPWSVRIEFGEPGTWMQNELFQPLDMPYTKPQPQPKSDKGNPEIQIEGAPW